ncbi:hypothetical protein [Hydrogenophaga sp. BPS33]|uniref:hypothetical protein n=1 Tax=Hydrogenophaga sp. BPS33 TaxID=2651974 RepID=UPI00131F74FC|nr:hypothetical protein [Hydrogenophaga sp. BPS33]QHE86237.1 hypothetical protein F9K07_15660 [Hydrogenophaga sp. BPS33]
MKRARIWTGIDRRASLSLGRSMRGLQTAALLPVRLRITGGGAVLRGPWMLRCAVRLPREHELLRGGPAQAARWLGGVHVKWLRRMGMAHVECYEGPVLEHWSCFAGRVPGEVVMHRQKITGIAQTWRRHDVLLTSGTLLSAVPWSLLCDAMHRSRLFEADALKVRAIDVQQCLGSLPPQPWAESLFVTLSEALLSAQPLAPNASEIRPIAHSGCDR